MIAIQSIEDIVDADLARRQTGVPPLLTDDGLAFFTKLLVMMRPLRLTQVTPDFLQPQQTVLQLQT